MTCTLLIGGVWVNRVHDGGKGDGSRHNARAGSLSCFQALKPRPPAPVWGPPAGRVVIGGRRAVTARLLMAALRFEEKMDTQAAPAMCRLSVGSVVVRLREAVHARA